MEMENDEGMLQDVSVLYISQSTMVIVLPAPPKGLNQY